MLDLIPGIAAPRRSWRRARWTWRTWSTLDPLTQEYEAERTVRGIALGVVLGYVVYATLWLAWRLW